MRIADFHFAPGARFQPGAETDAEEVGKHLALLSKSAKGELTPQAVVADARNPNSPLHSHFEWDDSEAAEQYRLNQARTLIRAVVAVYERPNMPAIETRMFVHVPAEKPHYQEAAKAMAQPSSRQLVLQRAWLELQQWRKRYQDLKEFSELFDVIDDVQKNIVIK